MSEQNLALEPADGFVFMPQDRRRRPTLGSVLSTALSLIVIVAALYQARDLDLSQLGRLVPRTPAFWVLFVVSYLAGPASEWYIFRRLWNIGPEGFGALVRKLIYNEMLLGYLGEAYFYGWARRHLKFVATPFGAVKDVAVLSAVAGNLSTLVFLALTIPFVRLLPFHDHATAVGLSLAFVILSSLGVMLFRGSIFSLDRPELKMVFTVHVLRILATTVLSAALWHLVLPDVALGWWLLLVTIRLLISRLPFIPNKDVVFAGIALLALGNEVRIGELMALMAGLILATHVIVGLSFAIVDLVMRNRADVPSNG